MIVAATQAEAAAPPVLAFEHVGKSFGAVRALRDVSFAIEEGEICAVMGENGAGKSTLMNILSGTFSQSEGHVRLRGRNSDFRTPSEALAAGIAIVHQELNLVETLTVAENIFIGRYPRRSGIVDWARMRRDTLPVLARVGAEDIHPDTRVSALSIGQQQLVEIARVLSMDPAILILDEPTSSLSERDGQRLLDVVRDLRNSGHTILYISHRMHEVLEIADSIVVLRDGRFIDRFPAEGTTEADIARLMVGRDVEKIERTPPPANARVVLELERVSTDEGIRDVSMQVRAGEIVGIAGLIGAGRSETARAIGGDTQLRSGRILVQGHERRWSDPGDAMRHGVAVVPEDRRTEGLDLAASIHENMILPFRHTIEGNWLVSGHSERGIVGRFFDRMQIAAPDATVAVGSLSGGNQQKAVLGKVFALSPKVIVFDEPTRGVDIAAKAEIHRIILDAAEGGAAIVLISSELPELLSLSDRILVMSGGRVAAELPRGASEHEVMMHAFAKS